MMKMDTLIRLALLAIVACSGCSSTRLDIQISPPEVNVKSVEFDGRGVKGSGSQYGGSVNFEKGQSTRDVVVRAVSRDDVEVVEKFSVTNGSNLKRTLSMPAMVQVRVRSPQPNAVTVRIDDELVNDVGGVYEKKIAVESAPRTVVAMAKDESRGIFDRQDVVLRAGQKSTVELNLGVTASLRAKADSIKYGESIEFDGSGSTPQGSISSFIWDFGDDSGKITTDSPRAAHTYSYDLSKGKVDQYTISLQVRAGQETSQPNRLNLPVRASEEKLVLDIEAYPRKRSFEPDETVQFKLTAQSAPSPELIQNLTLSFGDGYTSKNDDQEQPLTLKCKDGRCSPLIVSHAYKSVGRYELSVTYSRPSIGVIAPQEAQWNTRDSRPPVIVVSKAYLADDELIELAWLDFYKKFDKVLNDSGAQRKRLALTSLDNANFETEQAEFVPVIQRLTKMLVEDDDGYYVLEKTSQVLARLAPESIVNIRPEWEAEGISSDDRDEQIYRQNLDYGLATQHNGPIQPIVYSLRIEGTQDRIKQFDSSLQSVKGDGRHKTPGQMTPEKTVSEGQFSEAAWLRNLPILMARFKTAEILIALKVIEEPLVEFSPPMSYDEQIGEDMLIRAASVKLHVRLIERTGRIVRALDITGRYEELVPESFEEAREARRNQAGVATQR